jgi:hypothetical protein
MKQVIKFAFTLLLVANMVQLCAQPAIKTGLYKNESDFNLHKLTYAADCGSKRNLIRANNFFEPSKLSIIVNDKKMVVSKKYFFGYHDCTGKDYRFCQNKVFEIMDTASFCIYSNTSLEPNSGGKGYSTKTNYYFSKHANDNLQLLTVKNLRKAYPENSKFCFALESFNQRERELADYDPYLKTYKVKYLFEKSRK